MAKHEHGSMNIESQEATFAGFVRWSIGICVASAAVLIFMAIFRT
ncbi:hypothetical protein GCM10007939_21820 [Amylibacter marinus]|uniref:Cytochrome c oxidase subunit IV bacterial aa3 type domain-containing protein n=1 Tax=Amylibacter marinus TaxID=1475483 RepID=A0ABQ5VX90_9RHOB|nr:aa3-type cytochrome c oxidase subunit IV [Amylibacter marinus]GLQ35898.1 hypothetical protein GCM10007939_21820 [Amylibacter marinus]